ncbi:MAG: RagB/SusD family nutrient uptake outer membrane protein [Candidatus Symbiothrix sp.]|nr:RagB/SusD family nutrient uptake outer membrane protein [Candidatus Symbiothrix sp.]
MKHIVMMGIAALMLNSCYDLTPINYAEINPSIFPKSEKDLQALVMSCYYPLRGSWWDGINTTSEKGQMYVNDCCTEILTGKFDVQLLCSDMSYNEMSTGITWFYYKREEPYGYINKISRCTLVADEIANSTMTEAQKNRYMAEVRCARAFMSFILYDMFGPLVIAPLEVLKNPLDEKPLPRLSNDEMVKFIEDDLLFAAEHLPMPKAAEYGRFSAGFANMLLIRLYLHETVNDKHYYNLVDSLAREMMKPAWGYSLVSSYPSLFEAKGQTADNPEYIFVVPCSYEGYSQNQWHMMVMPPNIDGPVKGWQTIQSTWYFYDSFETADTRKTYLIDNYTDDKGHLVNRSDPGATMDLGPIPQKYAMDAGVAANNGYSDLDIVLYRYADVLLSLSEAIVMKPGGSLTQEAVDLMNTIRRRAGLTDKLLTDFPTTEAFIDQLLVERSHEFWCESGQYRADLIRFDKLYDRVMLLNNNVAPYASKEKYLFPLPLSVIVDGKGLVLQNPGYSN